MNIFLVFFTTIMIYFPRNIFSHDVSKGRKDVAYCPVTGQFLEITSTTPFVQFRHGQKLWMANVNAVQSYLKSPHYYWLSPYDEPLQGDDGIHGLPDMYNVTVVCPVSNDSFVINDTSNRIVHKNGQMVFFCCWRFVVMFWSDPVQYVDIMSNNPFNALDIKIQAQTKQLIRKIEGAFKNSTAPTVMLVTAALLLTFQMLVYLACIYIKQVNQKTYSNNSTINSSIDSDECHHISSMSHTSYNSDSTNSTNSSDSSIISRSRENDFSDSISSP